jgi:RNA polymerase sigma-70 factor, ECF subfamily
MSVITASNLGGRTISPDFEEIYREHSPIVYRTAKGILGNSHDAEDVLQSIFLSLLQRGLPTDLTRNPRAYLYRAAVNRSLDLIDARRRRRALTNEAQHITHARADSSGEEELHKRLYEAIAQLDSASAEIVILRYVHSLSDAEIAKTLGTSRSVIAVRLFRSRARLKKLLRVPAGGQS